MRRRGGADVDELRARLVAVPPAASAMVVAPWFADRGWSWDTLDVLDGDKLAELNAFLSGHGW